MIGEATIMSFKRELDCRGACKMALCILFTTLLSTGAALAQEQRFLSGNERNQLIELYTSEGCSSCPPADRWLAQFVDHPKLWQQIIPIAFHVDYWNYLGWHDRFSLKQHSRRQERLKNSGNIASVDRKSVV